jgi:hypothetical protein
LFRRLQVDLKVIWDISVDRLVLDSVETPDGGRCVKIFRRGGGTFGFEVYRRDAEDLSGWFPYRQFRPYTLRDRS